MTGLAAKKDPIQRSFSGLPFPTFFATVLK